MEIHSNDELGEKVVAAMRSIYSAPADAAYWDSLTTRIVSRARSSRDSGSLSVLAHWATPGLAAAALLFAVAGAMWTRLDQAELRNTYEGFTQPMLADAMPGAAQLLDVPRDGSSQKDATLGYVLSH
jgi:hypothetical protein